jgi:hypothetical protein
MNPYIHPIVWSYRVALGLTLVCVDVCLHFKCPSLFVALTLSILVFLLGISIPFFSGVPLLCGVLKVRRRRVRICCCCSIRTTIHFSYSPTGLTYMSIMRGLSFPFLVVPSDFIVIKCNAVFVCVEAAEAGCKLEDAELFCSALFFFL